MAYDPYDEVWYCIQRGRRSYMMQAAVPELIKCEDCRWEFNPMEAEFCDECKTSICPKCGRCNCIDDFILGFGGKD